MPSATKPTTNGTDASKPFFHTKLFINNEVSYFTSQSRPGESSSPFKAALLRTLGGFVSINCRSAMLSMSLLSVTTTLLTITHSM
jgi:hypothetical protein